MFCSINNKACLGISGTNSRRLMGPRRQQPPSCQLALSWLAWSLANSPTVTASSGLLDIVVGARQVPLKYRAAEPRGYLPWLKAVIVALTDDLSIFELEKHGGMGTHSRTSSQAAKSSRQRASPKNFDRQLVSVGHTTFELVALTRQQLSTLLESLRHT